METGVSRLKARASGKREVSHFGVGVERGREELKKVGFHDGYPESASNGRRWTMSKVRVYELAKEVGVDNKEVIAHAQKLGVTVDGHLTSSTTHSKHHSSVFSSQSSGGDVVQKRIRSTVIRRRSRTSAGERDSRSGPRGCSACTGNPRGASSAVEEEALRRNR